jgi:hypothetical protein
LTIITFTIGNDGASLLPSKVHLTALATDWFPGPVTSVERSAGSIAPHTPRVVPTRSIVGLFEMPLLDTNDGGGVTNASPVGRTLVTLGGTPMHSCRLLKMLAKLDHEDGKDGDEGDWRATSRTSLLFLL